VKGRIARAAAVAAAIGLVAPLTADPAAASPVAWVISAADSADTVDNAASGSVLGTPSPSPSPSPSESSAPAPSPTPTDFPTEAPLGANTAPGDPDEAHSTAAPLATDETAPSVLAAAAVIPSAGRLAGADRYATSVAASKAAFPAGAETVLVAEGHAYIDGVIAAGMAAALHSPLLYVAKDGIPADVSAELRRLAPARIVVLGGEAGVSAGAFVALRQHAPTVTRLAGPTRYGTSLAALAALERPFDTVYVVGGTSLVDAPLAFATASATSRGAILVHGQGTADAATVDGLRGVGAQRVVIVGGLGTVSASYAASLTGAGFAVERRSGADRYATSVLMAREVGSGAQRAIVANPLSPPDSSVAAALAGATRQPMLYASEACVPDAVAAHLVAAGLTVTGVGGPVRLSVDTIAGRSCSAVKAERESRLNTAIRSTMAQYAGSYWVSVQEISGLRQSVRIAGSTPKEPASMMKIYAAWAALTRVDQGRASLGMRLPSGVPLATCIHVMIHVSDNYCHTDIVHWVGIAEVNRMLRSAGFLNTSYGSVAPGVSVLYAGNRTTTNDLVLMMERLVNGSVLSRKLSDHLLREMGSQIGRSRIASGIPPGVKQSSKPGALWVASGLLQADTAVVYGPKFTYVLSIIGDNSPPKAAFQAISRVVYSHLNGSFGAAASYPVQQMATKSMAHFRSSPGGPIVATVGTGVLLEQLESQRTWYQVQYWSRKLWVEHTSLRDR
jgi:putative cell wall-binding protein/beta-lactamase class A